MVFTFPFCYGVEVAGGDFEGLIAFSGEFIAIIYRKH